MKELTEDADQDKALKDVTNATAKEKSKATEVAEKKGLRWRKRWGVLS